MFIISDIIDTIEVAKCIIHDIFNSDELNSTTSDEDEEDLDEMLWRDQHNFSNDRVHVYIHYKNGAQYNYDNVFKDSITTELSGSNKQLSFYTENMKYIMHSLGPNDIFIINEY